MLNYVSSWVLGYYKHFLGFFIYRTVNLVLAFPYY